MFLTLLAQVEKCDCVWCCLSLLLLVMSSSADMSGNGSFDDPLGVFSVAVAEASADAPTDAGADAGQDAVAEPAQSVSANPGGVGGAPRVAHRVAAREPLEVGNVVNSISGLRNQHLFLTYAQCAAPLVWVFAKVGHSRAVTGLAAVQEHHADGNLHIHLYLQKTKTVLPWDAVTFTWEGRSHRPNVRNLNTARYKYNAFQYLFKEGAPEFSKDFQEPDAPPRSAPSSSQDLLELASTSSVDAALTRFIREGGDLARVGPVQRGLQVLLAGPTPTPRWNPGYPQLELRPWESLLLSFLNELPERRRIFWVCGSPNSGKTTFSMWLENPANYTGGVLNLGACESTVNGLHNYRTEAVVILDYPLSFDWARKSETVSTLCETFSEFGSTRQSTKYMGRRVSICCHVVVMSNRLPIIEVRHRNVVLIETDSQSSQATTLVMEARADRGTSDGARSRSRSPLR